MSDKAHEELSRCVVQLLLKEPFYGHLLGGVTRIVSESVSTAAVAVNDNHISLIVHPRFFLEELSSTPERVAVVKHEALHLLFRHLFRTDPKHTDRTLMNIAADLVVNQWVSDPWVLPESALTLATFPDLGLQPDGTMEAYYGRLVELRDEMRTKLKAEGKNPNALDEETDWSSTSAPTSASILARMIGATWHSDHSQWGEASEVGEGRVDRLVEDAWKRCTPGKALGLPPAIQELIAEVLAKRKPQLDWKRALRIFGTTSRRTRLVGTTKRESKRFQTFPGIKVKRYQRIAVAVDTSGSVGTEELKAVFAEIHGMWRMGAEVSVLEVDDQVRRVYSYRGVFPSSVEGRGGTDFDPVFEYLNKKMRPRVDGCIYLTDGYAAAPTIRPPCKLLWVITPGGSMGEHLRFGSTILLSQL